MSKILEQAIQNAKKLSDDRQDEIGRWILDIIDQDTSNVQLSAAQLAEVYRRVHINPEPPVSREEAAQFFKKFA